MPNDAKLGLAVGVALVILVAVLFFRKGPASADPAATIVKPAPPATDPIPSPRGKAAVAQRTGYRPAAAPEAIAGRWHTVQAGESLYSLAQRYYGDGEKFPVLYRVNRDRLTSPDEIPPGTVLVIPDTPE